MAERQPIANRYALNRRVLVTGGAGFLGSHLCDRLIERGDEVLCVDNFFTGSRDNIIGLFGNPHFELMRHDVTLAELSAAVSAAASASGPQFRASQPEARPRRSPGTGCSSVASVGSARRGAQP